MKKPEHLHQLKKIDLEARSPLGQIPIDRMLENHIALFDDLRAAGFTWQQIAAGISSWRKKDGTPISADQLRGAFSRARRQSQSKLVQRPRPSVTQPPPEQVIQKLTTEIQSATQPTRSKSGALDPKTLLLLDKTRKARGLT